jgi:hypothetical protein
MPQFNYSNIGEVEKFNSGDYPHMVTELTKMISDVKEHPVYFKRDIIISYLKDHSIKTESIDANPFLVKQLTSGVLTTGHIERLFEGCRWNKTFRLDFESYIKAKLN